ncbi:hypothetical protein A8U91_00968 [Halomonas elongata]|uniref:Uncharacterized protein n=2 Tax=Halomonas elongata TaxID=2746 RepID=A0A1B8P2W4_HALEL|nr:hypothetical protein A8U91_00968 [Halomonas elongata]
MTLNDHGYRVAQSCQERYTAHPEDPGRARADIVWHYRAGRDEGPGRFDVSVESRYRLTCDETTFFIEAEQIAHDDGEEVHRKHWRTEVPRRAI